MSKEIKHSPEISKIPEINSLKESLGTLQQSLNIHPILAFLEEFDSFFKKKKRILTNNEVLFTPGENPYFYVISSGALSILRMTPTGEKKEIGRAYTGSFIGEGVLFDRNQKDIEAVAIGEGASVVTLTKEDITYLESQNPEKILALFKHIIEITNSRLLDAGKEIASLYEINIKIDELSSLGEQGFKDIINHISKTLDIDYIISIEQHPAVPGLFIHKYNSRFPSIWPINQKAIEEIREDMPTGEIVSTGNILGTSESDNLYLVPLKTRKNLKGYFILGKKNKKTFNNTDMRIMNNIAPLLGSMIENNQTLAEKKALSLKQENF
ncbi:MAG: cyclic nucleotide-binding domain-containing protein [Candidatus Gracilibacteria bacterium]|nr:cyclic nucleotide-binding domain-containing protein [Candidatus Gracilibacteria bacterium]